MALLLLSGADLTFSTSVTTFQHAVGKMRAWRVRAVAGGNLITGQQWQSAEDRQWCLDRAQRLSVLAGASATTSWLRAGTPSFGKDAAPIGAPVLIKERAPRIQT